MIYRHGYEMVTDDIFLQLPELVAGSDVFLKLEGSIRPARSSSRPRSA